MNTEEALSGPEMGAAILSNYRMLSAESDRGAVLLASSIIERGLTELICAFLLESDNKRDELFTGPAAPLGTLESKIAMAYRLGLIRNFVRDYLDIFRRMRNDFAHNIERYSFDDPCVRNRLNEIYKLRKEQSDFLDRLFLDTKKEATVRDKFLMFFSSDMAAIQRVSLTVERIVPLD